MPTYKATTRFIREYKRLSADDRAAFRRTLREFRGVLKGWEVQLSGGLPRFPARLGVKGLAGHPGILEMAWAPNGRCTWQFGPPLRAGTTHIIWRRIGSHAIYQDP
jgi:hypothetical protein